MKKKHLATAFAAVLLLSGCQSQFNVSGDENQSHPEKKATKEEKVDKQTSNEFSIPDSAFNVIKEIGGKKIIQNPDNMYALVNKTYALPESYIPRDLVRANVSYSFGDAQIEKALMRKEAAEALADMFNAAKQENIELFAVSGYRSYVRQEAVFNNDAAKKGIEEAKKLVAVPGESEHQTGLTMDISAHSVNLDVVQEFENTAEGKWLADNAHKYGFILRYPKGKETITQYEYEPWHFRYVGKKYATIIYENNLTLEEFFERAHEAK
ncbi:M15 family metallopeptidase [Bacillus testis]|uniref:M15 family metallopeptidase n=1 Tax=Bacillus testis TaxID=1622072 RepID=UPI00067E713E|nr:M15 family metallopeptidase [Bacillus testis]